MLKVRRKYSVIAKMIRLKNLQTHNRIRKVCALGAATLILPVLAYADRDNDKSNRGDNDGQRRVEKDEHRWGNHDQDRDRERRAPVVPETNAGWVLVPFFGAVLLFSARQFFRPKAAQK
jgi:hypothetical protein